MRAWAAEFRRGRCLTVAALLLLVSVAEIATGAARAAAAEPVTASHCGAVVTGEAGSQVLLAPDAVTDQVAALLGPLDLLGVLAARFREEWQAQPPLPVGSVPSGEAVIPGDRVAESVVRRVGELPLLAPVLDALVSAVRDVLGRTCSLIVRGERPGGPDGSDGAGGGNGIDGGDDSGEAVPAPAGSARGGPGSEPRPGVWDRDPGGAPPEYSIVDDGARLGVPGLLVSPDGLTFDARTGRAPGFGILDAETESGRETPSRHAGTALALRTDDADIHVPVVVAVLVLTLVSTQLIRVWTIRGTRRG